MLVPSHIKARADVEGIMKSIEANAMAVMKPIKQRQLLYTEKYKHSTFLTGKVFGSDSVCNETADEVEFAIPIKQWYSKYCWSSSNSGYLSVDDAAAGRSSKVAKCFVGSDGNIQVQADVYSRDNCTGVLTDVANFAIRDDTGVVVRNGDCVLVGGIRTVLTCTEHYSFKGMTGHVVK